MSNGRTTRHLNGELSRYTANSSSHVDYTLYLQLCLTGYLNLKLEMKVNLLINARYLPYCKSTNFGGYKIWRFSE